LHQHAWQIVDELQREAGDDEIERAVAERSASSSAAIAGGCASAAKPDLTTVPMAASCDSALATASPGVP
jgi:hypothetical protein